MRIKHMILPGVAALFLLGCGPGTKNETAPIPGNTSATSPPKTVAEAKDAVVAAWDKQLADLDTKISELRKKSEGYKDDAKVAADQALASLGESRAKAAAKLEELKKTGADAWKDVKAGVDTAIGELEKAYEAAKAKFN